MTDEEYFGDESRRAATRRAAVLWTLLKSTGKYRYYGRALGLNGPSENRVEQMAALAHIQGVGICYYCPKEDADTLFPALQATGLRTDRHEQYRGGAESYELAKQLLDHRALPEDLQLVRLNAATPPDFLREVAAMCEAEGVTPVPASIMRGVTLPGLVLVAVDGEQRPVASASSHQMLKPEFEHGRDVFWGALTTRPDRRGEGIALYLGALAIKLMWEEHGARGFMTGVRRDNISSQKLCEKLGVVDTEWMLAQCIDPGVLGSSRHTK